MLRWLPGREKGYRQLNDDEPRQDSVGAESIGQVHRRRVRYAGTHPRKFEEKYKERDPQKYSETVSKVLESGKTPAGTHRPIMVQEILSVLGPRPGNRVVDATLGYGGHTMELLRHVAPGGHVLGLDCDPIELPKTEQRMTAAGFGPDVFTARRSNYAGILHALSVVSWPSADCILADLGVSSMQLDDPSRGFSVKNAGPLDMRMNPNKGVAASEYLSSVEADSLEAVLLENADEPNAGVLARRLASRTFKTTSELASAIRQCLSSSPPEEQKLAIRRVFQALRIVVNDEFGSLETFLRHLPSALSHGGRVAILTFHSGEDRRVKKAFREGLAAGVYSAISDTVGRASAEERRANPRSIPAKLRWAVRAL